MKAHFIKKKYAVDFDEYAERYYIKDFARKHKKHWEVTRTSIKESLERIANLEGSQCLDTICEIEEESLLVKYDFKVAKTNVSPKASGNRCILEVSNKNLKVRILLVYCKGHIDRPDGQETLWWKGHVSSIGVCCTK